MEALTAPNGTIVFPHPEADLDGDARKTNNAGGAIVVVQDLPRFGRCFGVYNTHGILFFPVEEEHEGPYLGYFQAQDGEILVPTVLDTETHWFGDSGWLAYRIGLLRAALRYYLGRRHDEAAAKNVRDLLAEVLSNPAYATIVAAVAVEAALKAAGKTHSLDGLTVS